MPFFEPNITSPPRVAARLRRARAQDRAARAGAPLHGAVRSAPADAPPEHADDVRTTLDATIRPVGNGRYRTLSWAPGEDHLLRDDLGATPSPSRAQSRRSLLYVAHHTDIHICDSQSPARMVGGQAFGWVHPGSDAGHRPQETMTTHVFDQLVRATNRVTTSPVSGASMAWCIQTGDHTDNRTAAEVEWWLDVLAGRTVTPDTGLPGSYEGVQRSGWRAAWNPDLPGVDRLQRHGFPYLPGVLDAAVAPFDPEGLAVPWLTVLGNHDRIFSGTFGPAKGLRIDRVEAMVRDSTRAPVSGSSLVRAIVLASLPGADTRRWERWAPRRGTTAATPDPAQRRALSHEEYLTRIFAEQDDHPGAGQRGHGFDAEAGSAADTWWSRPHGMHVQVIGLDTTNRTNGDEGRLGPRQTAWLEQELARHHTHRFDEHGRSVPCGGHDRLVVVVSHHNSWVMDNHHDDQADPGPATDGAALVALLGRYPNVVLWFNGHSHQHRIAAHRVSGSDADATRRGFWEVCTASVANFGQQGRTFEFFDNQDGTVSILVTVLDQAAPPTMSWPPPGGWTPTALAALSRELSVNDDRWFDPVSLLGERDDRNVELCLTAPFALGR